MRLTVCLVPGLLLLATSCIPLIPPPQQGGDPPEGGEASPPGAGGGDVPARRGAPGPAPAGGGGEGKAAPPAAPSVVSVSIRSRCPKTARVFYGSKPKFGSGTTSTVSSNSVSSHSFRPGDMMWTVDESDNGLSSVTVSASTREIEVGPDCRSLQAR